MSDSALPQRLDRALAEDVEAVLADVRSAAVARVRERLIERYAEALLAAVTSEPARRPKTEPASRPSESAGTPPAASPDAVWIYAVTRADGGAGIADALGVWQGAPVRCVTAGTLAAVVSDVNQAEMAGLVDPASGAPDPALIDAVRAHDAVVDAAFRNGPIVPLRFGTVVTDDHSVLRVLREHAGTLTDELSRLSRGREWGVTLSEIADERTPAPTAPAAAPAPVATGTEYLQQRGSQRSARARQLHDRHAAVHQARTRLAALATEATYGPTRRDDGTQVLLNGSFFVDAAAEPEFLRSCDELARELSLEGIRVDRSGPWPPYHFVAVELEVHGA